ncbi:MAG TPA: hypothetical protein PKC24_01570 [Cyclobacteriaceae bacterium]|mgnify:CR=1 FL=1|nr:hypothetical protein [Cyclobacteriaceae bacterium]
MKKIILSIGVLMIAAITSYAQIKVKSDDVLIILNGNESSVAELEKIKPDLIESIEVIKGADAKKLYGKKAKAGLLIVQMKSFTVEKGIDFLQVDSNNLSELFPEGPLFIVEGTQYFKTELGDIDPDNIQSIEVLKGKTATDRFGERGEHGVVVIKLKSARK